MKHKSKLKFGSVLLCLHVSWIVTTTIYDNPKLDDNTSIFAEKRNLSNDKNFGRKIIEKKRERLNRQKEAET